MKTFQKIPSISFFCLWVCSFFLSAHAGVLVNAPSPYYQYEMGDDNVEVSYFARAGVTTPSAGELYPGFRAVDTLSTTQNLVILDIVSNAQLQVGGAQKLVLTLSLTTSAGSEVPIRYAGVVSDDSIIPDQCYGCQGDNSNNLPGTYLSVQYTTGSKLRVLIAPSDICSLNTANTTFCNSGAVASTSSGITQTIYATVGAAQDAYTKGPVSGGADTQISFTLRLTDASPTNNTSLCPSSSSQFYFPGDGEIILNSQNFVGFTKGNGGALLSQWLFLAKRAGAVTPVGTSGWKTQNDIFQTIDYGTLNPRFTGLSNATDSGDSANTYQGKLYVVDRAGLISPDSSACFENNIQSREITGALSESQCFIATAAYHDGRAAPVMLLRHFRDKVLLKSSMGQWLVKQYYQHSPALALWSWDKPWVRLGALKYLTWVEIVALFALYPVLSLLTLWCVWFFIVKKKFTKHNILFFPFFLLALLSFLNHEAYAADETTTPAASNSVSPYIEAIKKQMEFKGSSQNGVQNYIDEQKKKLDEESKSHPQSTGEGAASYTEEIKKQLKHEEPTSYLEAEKSKLPPEKNTESYIKRVQAGKSGIDPLEKPPIKNAVGFKLGVAPGMQVQSGTTNTFDEVYGNTWKPEFLFHYERQFFNDPNLGSMGIFSNLGISVTGAYGLLKFPFNNDASRRSMTSFTLLQLPALVGGVYRFNLLRLVKPYVGAGGGVMGYLETREDNKPNKKGFSAIYGVQVGAMLLLDFLDPKTMRDGFLSLGIQHAYFILEYLNEGTVFGKVKFGRSGLYSGFLFEF